MSEVANGRQKVRVHAATGCCVSVASALEEVGEGGRGGGDVVEDSASDVCAGVVLHSVDKGDEGAAFDEAAVGVGVGAAFADAHFEETREAEGGLDADDGFFVFEAFGEGGADGEEDAVGELREVVGEFGEGVCEEEGEELGGAVADDFFGGGEEGVEVGEEGEDEAVLGLGGELRGVFGLVFGLFFFFSRLFALFLGLLFGLVWLCISSMLLICVYTLSWAHPSPAAP